MKLGTIPQKASPFLSKKKTWDDDEVFPFSAEIKKGIVEELNFSKPAIIQAVAIPLILSTDEETETHQNLIA